MLAEEDLKMRGPGEFFGTRQSSLPDLKVAEITDYPLIVHTREVAKAILGEDPTLSSEKYSALANYVRQRHIMWCSNVYSVVFSKSIYAYSECIYYDCNRACSRTAVSGQWLCTNRCWDNMGKLCD